MDLVEYENEVDFEPFDGWLQKYVFFYYDTNRGRRVPCFQFANQIRNGIFTAKGHEIGNEWVSMNVHNAYSNSTKHIAHYTTKEYVGVWAMAIGIEFRGRMYWQNMFECPQKVCKEMIEKQRIMINKGLLNERPNYGK